MNEVLLPGSRAATAEVLGDRAAALAKLIRENPRRALELALPESELARIRALAPDARIEERGEWTGTAQVLEADPGGRFVLLDDLRIHFAFGEPEGLGCRSTLRVRGIRLGEQIAAASATVISASADECSALGEQRLAAVLIKTQGRILPYSDEEVREMVLSSTQTSLSDFVRRNSYGKAWLPPDSFMTVELSRGYACAESTKMMEDAIQALGSRLDTARFNRLFFFFLPQGECEWGGLSTLGCSRTIARRAYSVSWVPIGPYLSRARLIDVIVHEAGHALGLAHSRLHVFGDNPLGAPNDAGDTRNEYGDEISAMGHGKSHYAAPHKARLGWLAPDEIAQVEDSRRVSILPFASQAAGIKAARVKRGPSQDAWLWLESHQPVDPYESMTNPQAFAGATVHYEDASTRAGGTYDYETILVDFTPRSTMSSEGYFDTALAAGKDWADPFGTRVLRVVSAGTAGLTFDAAFDEGCASAGTSASEHGAGEESGTIPVSAASSCSWDFWTYDTWIQLKRTAAGVEYRLKANETATARQGIVAVGRQFVTITQRGIPFAPGTPVAYPNSGGGPFASFQFTYPDANGPDDLRLLRFDIGPGQGCAGEYDVTAGAARLTGDSASRCQMQFATITPSQQGLTLNIGLRFLVSDGREWKISLSAQDSTGLESGWHEAGTWAALANFAPEIASLSPAGGTGMRQVFTLTATDANGVADIVSAGVVFAGAGTQACSIQVVARSGLITVTGKAALCTLDSPSLSASGNKLTVRLPVSFSPEFAGEKTVRASVGDFSGAMVERQMGTWTVGAAPVQAPAVEGVTNAASFQTGAVAPGETIVVFGTGLGPAAIANTSYENGLLPGRAGETEVYFGNLRAPMVYSLAGQVSAIVPYGVSGSTRMRVEYQGRPSDEVELQVAAAAPGIFTRDSSGRGAAVVVNQDGALNAPDNPAARGSLVTLFITGEGAMQAAQEDGRMPGPPWPVPAAAVKVEFGGVEGAIDFIGLRFAGVTQINVRVPESAPAGGSVPLVVKAAGTASGDGVTLALR